MIWKEIHYDKDHDELFVFWNGECIYKKWYNYKPQGTYKIGEACSKFFDKYGIPLKLDGSDK